MYAVRHGERSTVKYVEVTGKNILLRPHNQAYPVELVPIEPGKTISDYIIGRVCYIGIET
jgi:SOS-response transcriptional repressor LexA